MCIFAVSHPRAFNLRLFRAATGVGTMRTNHLQSLSQKLAALVVAIALVMPTFGQSAHACACCDTYRVTGVEDWDVLNVRSRPSARSRIVGALDPGTCGIEILRDRRGWLKIRFGDTRGWVNGRYIEFR